MSNTNPELRPDKNGKVVTRHVSSDTQDKSLRRLLNLPPRGFSVHDSKSRVFALPADEQRDEVLTILHESGLTQFEQHTPSTSDTVLAYDIVANSELIRAASADPDESEQALRWANGVVALDVLKGIENEIGASRSEGRVPLVEKVFALPQLR